MFTIRQMSETEWEILGPDGDRVGATHATYDLAVAFLGGMVTYAQLADQGDGGDSGDGTGDGLLPEGWVSDPALCFSEPTGDGRDFTGCEWSSRDVNSSTLPLMLQTETEFGHFGAQLAGFITELGDLGAGTNPTGRGRFYDNEAGRQFRDMLLAGRSFGVSVDPGRVEVDWECTAEDEDGYCIAEVAMFRTYEIIGVTGTPFPGFAAAAIRLDTDVAASGTQVAAGAISRSLAAGVISGTNTVTTGARAIVAGGTLPVDLRVAGPDLVAPPADWFTTPEPALGEPFVLGDLGDEWLVDQGDGRLAMPLEITDDGRVLGHLAVDGECHIGYQGRCVSPPASPSNYARFHVGMVRSAEGERIATGPLTAGCDHAASQLRAPAALDHYAHNGIAWANVRITAGVHGPFVSGALRHDVTPEQVAIYRAGALSGDWRQIGTGLDLIAALAVSTPGFTIAREAIVASGLARMVDAPHVRMSMVDGEQISLVASGIVRRCPDCARRAAAAASRPRGELGTRGPRPDPALERIEQTLTVLERRTRHLARTQAEELAARIRG